MLKEDGVTYYHERLASDLAYKFSHVTGDKIEGYFKRHFNPYVKDNIYITEQGYYAVFHKKKQGSLQ